jgi:hypothetical protein
MVVGNFPLNGKIAVVTGGGSGISPISPKDQEPKTNKPQA